MADRSFFPPAKANEPEVVDLFAKVEFGLAGAPTVKRGRCFKGVDHAGAGIYLVKLADRYLDLLGVQVTTVGITQSAPVFHVPIHNIGDDTCIGVASFNTVVATNKLTVNGVAFTAVASGATGDQFDVGESDSATATNAATAINTSETEGVVDVVSAFAVGPAVVILARSPVSIAKTGTTITLTPAANLYSDPALLVRCTSAAGAATDPGPGEEALVRLTMRNSNAG